jgi:hypothetical protein
LRKRVGMCWTSTHISCVGVQDLNHCTNESHELSSNDVGSEKKKDIEVYVYEVAIIQFTLNNTFLKNSLIIS